MSTDTGRPSACDGVPDDGVRQHIVHMRGSRRARLTAAPGTTGEPVAADEPAPDAHSGPNDERMRREKPPHY